MGGVTVGYSTLISGEGKLEVGQRPVRTGVTAILPRGADSSNDPVYAGVFSLNALARMRAVEVLPMPRAPTKR